MSSFEERSCVILQHSFLNLVNVLWCADTTVTFQFQFHSDRFGWWNIVDWVKGTVHSRPPGGNKSPESCGGRPDCKKEDDANFLSMSWMVMKRITESNRAELIYVSITRFIVPLVVVHVWKRVAVVPSTAADLWVPLSFPKVCVYMCVYIYMLSKKFKNIF